MKQAQEIIDTYTNALPIKVRIDPINELHLPSLLLGLAITGILGPLLNLFLGTILSSLLTLLKYVVIIGLFAGILFVAASGKKNNNNYNSSSNTNDVHSLKANKHEKKNRKVTKQDRSEREEFINAAISPYTIRDRTEMSDPGATLDKLNKIQHREPSKEDFEKLKYYDIPITKSNRFEKNDLIDKHDPYENFITMAQTRKK
ncbi:hypothetical protein TPHA_0F01630 [Tetrapisispora phaffii CBS 4417]|uniref:Uncharacterized protein n=1 Tax=Tetrapisispora phaffii (strain ATCC 24235 / CBS 4417 / NBRC 1672 / NRRL Y-8282 / UCD 70-5) TaxID=1071381 RepID=G8BV65_TETPH|nr:hypothetical protein TPHA_0F01630 [Tetrapisispora phaffii CBS 4417]CCE63647.1 hypothetical protein TPHA_0F01630 [Tetrapisispora phaffii CBS 4417]